MRIFSNFSNIVSSSVLKEDILAMRVGVQKAVDELEALSAQDLDENSINWPYLTRLKVTPIPLIVTHNYYIFLLIRNSIGRY